MRRALLLLTLSLILLGLGTERAYSITINEILYSPKPGGPNLEFVELFNEASEPVDLSNFYFVNGIQYMFPYPTFIKGTGYIVVAADPDALLAANPYLQSTEAKFPKVVGPFGGKLDDAGERITLTNAAGAIMAEMRYNNRGSWPAEAEKTGHSLILEDPYLDPSLPKNWSRSPLMGGSPGLHNLGETIFEETVIVADGEVWRYLKGLKAQETDPDPPSVPVEVWRLVGFDDSAWLQGAAPIGVDSPAKPEFLTVLDDIVDSYLSVFFRKEFEIATKDGIDQLILKLGYDDGFVAYLNGTEVGRKNIRTGEEGYANRAAISTETKFGDARESFNLTPFIKDSLLVGKNVLAVQVHNNAISNNDLGFAPMLLSRKEKTIGGHEEIPVRVNELSSSDPASRWLELHNEGSSPVDLSGYYISDDPTLLAKFQIPAGKIIEPRSWLTFSEEELLAAEVRLVIVGDQKSLWLGLTTPALDQVVDAHSFQPPATAGLTEARYPDGKRDWIIARNPTPGKANEFQVETDVVLNEIMYHPFYPYGDFPDPDLIYDVTENQGEYVELFNKGTRTISLKGWTFTEAFDYAFADDATIGPGQYLVIAKDPDWLAAHYGLERAKILGPYYNLRTTDAGATEVDVTSGFLADDGEEIELRDELGNEVDVVRYHDSGSWSVWADGRGSSLELIDPNQDDSEAAAWDASDESAKSEWTHYSYTARTATEAEFKFILMTMGMVAIDNVSIKDATTPTTNYVPYGTFEQPLKATEVLFGGTHVWSGIVAAPVKDGTGALRIVSTGRGNNRQDRIEFNTFTPTLPLNRQLLIEFDAKWLCGEGVLLTAGYNHTMAMSHRLAVPERLGTPGAENSVHVRLQGGNLGPIISNVHHSPVVPGPGEPVLVTAKISDSDGMASAQIAWKLDEAAASTISLVDLLDDGNSEDGDAGDGVYGGHIPGQALNKIVTFTVVATDTLGNSMQFPLDRSERTGFLRENTANLPASLRTNPPRNDFVYQHLNYAPDSVRSYRMIFSRENWTYLSTRPIMSNDLVSATFVFNDQEAYYDVGVRFGNSPWTRPSYSPTNQSYRAKFGKDNLFQGWRKFKMDNQRNENYMEERIAYYLFRGNFSYQAGGTAPYLTSLYCQPYISYTSGATGTQQRLAHIYDHVEVPSKPFLDKWWPGDSDGVLYKVDDRFEVNDDGTRRDSVEARVIYPPASPASDGRGDSKENYRWFFMHRTRDKYDSYSELMDLARVLDTRTTPNATDYNQKLFQIANVEEMVRNWSISINVDDWDTWGTTRGKNCYLYRPRVDGRWTVIPWDKDLIFGNVSGLPIVPGNHAEVARILNSPNGSRIYKNVLSDMLSFCYTPAYITDYFSEVAKTAPAGSLGTYTRAASFVQARTNTIKSAIGTQPVPFAITRPAAAEVTQDQNTVSVVGTAPYGVWSIVLALNDDAPVLLSHEDGGLTWSSTRWTTKSIQLQPGRNTLAFFGFNGAGDILGDDQVTVIVNDPTFVRGDADKNGLLELTDAIVILNHLFRGEGIATCHDMLDADDTGIVDMTDAIHILRHLFQGGDPPPAPYPTAGIDPTLDDLVPCGS